MNLPQERGCATASEQAKATPAFPLLKPSQTQRDGNEARRFVTVTVQGDYGKTRPALVIQSDYFDLHLSVTILPLTSALKGAPLFRITVDPRKENGLTRPSQVIIDKALTVLREKIGPVIGRLGDDEMIAVTRSLALFLGFA